MLEYKKNQEITKQLLGGEYFDYNLVVCLPDGKPCEQRLIEESFQKLRAQADMVTKVYANILDEDRKVNAIKLQKVFYSQYANPDLRGVQAPDEAVTANTGNVDMNNLLSKLVNAPPETLTLLANLFGVMQS